MDRNTLSSGDDALADVDIVLSAKSIRLNPNLGRRYQVEKGPPDPRIRRDKYGRYR